MGSDAYMKAYAADTANQACALVGSLMELPPPVQDKFLALCSSLQP
jgi:hypothetical protein